MSATPDYYRVLQVHPDAPGALIHASYRTLLQRLRSAEGTPAGIDAALLEEAYGVLGDPRRRAAYDAQCDNAATQHLPAPGADVAATSACLFCGTPHGLQRLEPDDDCRRCGSPLSPAERQRLDYSGHRMLNRIPKQRSIQLQVTWPQPEPLPAEMRDLSLNGMQFTAAVRLELNQIVRIDCQELRALGRVAHATRDGSHPDRWIVGVEFLTLRFRQSRGSFVSAHV